MNGRWWPFLDDASAVDLLARDRLYAHFGGIAFGGTSPVLLAAKLLRVLARHPGDVAVALRWAGAAARRVGGIRRLAVAAARRRVRLMAFVVHAFMDAEDVAPAWTLLERGEISADPAVRATQDRLRACVYTMAHPDIGRLVPACVQHCVLDPAENAALRRLLPIVETR